jgi:murein DD-endopeptidase MepM/ murein hydrolase activator NlpD
MKNYTSLLLISRRHNTMHSISISARLLKALSIIGASILTITIVLSAYNARVLFAAHDMRTNVRENAILLARLDSLRTALSLLHSDFDEYIAQDNRQRTFWGMECIHPDIWSMGIGGTESKEPQSNLSHRTNNILNDIYASIDILKNKSNLRKLSLSEVDDKIETKTYLWDHIPSVHPVPGRPLGSGFGYRVDPITKKIKMHWGIDIGAPRGTNIHVTADGVVSSASWHGGYGLTVEINHGFGYRTRYGHCQRILVKKGDVVKRGQVIAAVGNTGRSVAPHLHYEVHVSGVKVNPRPYIDLSDVVFD